MNKKFLSDYYDLKYGEDIEGNMTENESFQEIEYQKSKLEKQFIEANGGVKSDNVRAYEQICALWFDYTKAAMKEMYLRGAEDREKMLEI